MRRRTLISMLILLMISGFGYSQIGKLFKSNEARGDDFFYTFSYPEAIQEYEIAYSKSANTDVSLKIAESYRKLNDPANAAIWYAKAVEQDISEPEAFLHYAEALSSLEKYDEAKKWYGKYESVSNADSRPSRKIETISNLSRIEDRSEDVKIKDASFNSKVADFSPTFFEESSVVFVSSRAQEKPIQQLFNWDKSEYLNLFIADESGQVRSFQSNINSKYHEGPASFYDSGNQIIFTRNDYLGQLGRSQDGITKLKLYSSKKSAEEWSKPVPFPYNNSDYSVGHPTVSEDGETLIFVSDMPGSIGGTDLYMCEWTDSGWSKPVNLGENVNTEGNEMFPFLSMDQELFFASDGHGGLGGLDQFGIKFEDLNTGIPINLGVPLNSSLDDFGLIIRGNSGYFSSNRLAGSNKDDVYSFITKIPLIPAYKLTGRITSEESGDPLIEAVVYLAETSGKIISHMETDKNGNYQMTIEPGKQYVISVSKDQFLEGETNVNVNDKTKLDWIKNLALKPDYGFNLLGEITERGTSKPIDSVHVEIIDNMTGKKVIDIVTKGDGEFIHSIDDKELNDRVSYQIKLSKDGYLSKTATLNTELKVPGNINLKDYLDLNLDKIEVGTDIGKLIDLKPIYFDLGKSVIREDAGQELDKMVEIMRENPTIEIELGSHTDSRGRAESNLRLSDKRAKASADYIVSKGIDASRIVGQGYGESRLINECADGVKCSEEKHQLNRRTEFKITRIK